MIGVDEVGRGCLAGPLLVVAANQLSKLPDGLKDSKVLTRSRRQELLLALAGTCRFGEGWVEPPEIDNLGLADALRLGIERALQAAGAAVDDEIIYDGPVNYAPVYFQNVKCLIDADNLIPLVSAASIYAKVKRDEYMGRLSNQHPDYGFANHVGYATRRHMETLRRLGPIKDVHRMSFSPLRQTGLEL